MAIEDTGLTKSIIDSIKTTLIPGMSDLFKSEDRKKADSIAKSFADEKTKLEQKYRDEQKRLSHELGSEKEMAQKEKEHQDALINLEKERALYV